MAGTDYYCATHTVVGGKETQDEIDLSAELLAKSRAGGRFVQIRTDKDLTVRFNASTYDAIVIDVSVNPELTIQHAPGPISKIYLQTVGNCASGDATVQVLVM